MKTPLAPSFAPASASLFASPFASLFASLFALAVCILTLGCSSPSNPVHSTLNESEADNFSSLTVTDIDGQSLAICEPNTRGVLLIFTARTCPIANAYAPRIQQIYEKYSELGIQCLLVNVDPRVSDEQLREHAQEYKLTLPVIHDTTYALVSRASATVTPQAVLFDPQGQIAYSGRIDDQYVDFGAKRRQPSRHDLVDALDTFLAGKTVTPSTTKAVGCYIGDLTQSRDD